MESGGQPLHDANPGMQEDSTSSIDIVDCQVQLDRVFSVLEVNMFLLSLSTVPSDVTDTPRAAIPLSSFS